MSLKIAGPTGLQADVEAVIDTGFSDYLTLPPAVIRSLDLEFRESALFSLAVLTTRQIDIYVATVLWLNGTRPVLVSAVEGTPLIGMSLLYGSRLTVDIVDGGPVSIVPLS